MNLLRINPVAAFFYVCALLALLALLVALVRADRRYRRRYNRLRSTADDRDWQRQFEHWLRNARQS
jgi:hypothetical protein